MLFFAFYAMCAFFLPFFLVLLKNFMHCNREEKKGKVNFPLLNKYF